MASDNPRVFNSYHNIFLLAFIKALNDIDCNKHLNKSELSQYISKHVEVPETLSDKSVITKIDERIEKDIDEAIRCGILEEDENSGKYRKIATSNISLPMSVQEKIYLLNILNSPYSELFLDDNTISKLKEGLSDIPDIDLSKYIIFRGVDELPEFSDENKAVFRRFITAIHEKRKIRFINHARNGRIYNKNVVFLPMKIEFSVIHRSFYFSLWHTEEKRPVKADWLRISGLELLDSVSDTGYLETQHMMEDKKAPKPITLIIRNDEKAKNKNVVERVSLLFSMYEREMKYLDDGSIQMEIFYYEFDEREIIDGIMSFGPDIQVLKPDSVVNKIRDRLI